MRTLTQERDDADTPFLIGDSWSITPREIVEAGSSHLDDVAPGEVVGLIGDFDARSISDLITLIDRRAIVMPLSPLTRADHQYFFDTAGATRIVEHGNVSVRSASGSMELVTKLCERGNPGLILFSTGTTGRPKAILHDMSLFLERYRTPRKAFRMLNFLLFDHIGGINTLFHTLFNSGVAVSVNVRTVEAVATACREFDVEVLPTTPTFLRMVLLSGARAEDFGTSLRVITYGTERMDQATLDAVTGLFPDVDFRQTYGMSELGILRVKSEARDSLFMKVGGEGVQTRITNDVLEILSPTRMMGYLNAPSPFDQEGWYNTGDVVISKGDLLQVVGRTNEVINVGGIKFMASEVEEVALQAPNVQFVAVEAIDNPITGQHVEITVQPSGDDGFSVEDFRHHLNVRLPRHMLPRRVRVGKVSVGHRLKRS